MYKHGNCKRGRRHKTGAKCAVHKDENCFLCDPTWAQDVCAQRSMSLSCLLYQGCDVTTVQQHYTGSASTPPRVASLCQIREASLVALRKISKIYAVSHVSIVRLVQSIILVSRDSHCHSSPLYHLPGELVSLSSVPMPSIDLNLWNLSRPSVFVPMSLGFTSVLTDDIVKSFRNTKS